MRCPICEGDSKVTDSRECRKTVKRRRECLVCGEKYTTLEVPYRPTLCPWRQCKICGKKVANSTMGWALCPEHLKAKNAEWKRLSKNRDKDRDRRKLCPTPRDKLREMFPRRIANMVTRGEMSLYDAMAYKKEEAK